MKLYQVIASQLNFRSSPAKLQNNVIGILYKGQVLEVLDSAHPVWWKVKVSTEIGYVRNDYIDDIDSLKALKASTGIEEAELQKNSAALRTSRWKWHYPLSEAGMPGRDLSSLENNINSQYAIVEYLAVDNAKHLRYAKTIINDNAATFCNIYAHDFCKLCGVYLPRVWWKEQSVIPRLLKNEEVIAEHNKTVNEMNANALYDWLVAWGEYFGWKRASTWQEAQSIVNSRGAVGVICSRRIPVIKSGHIACILPESNSFPVPNRDVNMPLISQAGQYNFKYKYDKWDWSNKSRYSNVGFWYNLSGITV